MLVGDGLRNTIITSARSVQDGYTTYSSATAGIDGLHFIARDITFQNTAGPHKAWHDGLPRHPHGSCTAPILWPIKPFEGQANMITAQARELSKILKFRSTTLKSGPHQTSGPLLTNTTLSWVGLGNKTLDPAEASQFTVTRLLAGPTWLASATVPFTSGL
ncbi:hypothetical protein JHK82_017055 [Glycine max]|nr:hypothetical protein JHK82_017055 [Glycine max]